MANYTPNSIYTYVRNRFKEVRPDVYVAGVDEPIPNQQASVKIAETGRYRPKGNVRLSNDDQQYSVSYDVNVYSNLFNDHTQEAYDIMSVAEQAFRELFFIETSCIPLERTDNRVTRLTARFQRQVCEGDVIPE